MIDILYSRAHNHSPGMIPPELVLLKRTNFEARYFHTFKCPEMPPVKEAEGFCHDVAVEHRALLEQVLWTPPFVSCPARNEESVIDKL